jgi:hypothetical protein
MPHFYPAFPSRFLRHTEMPHSAASLHGACGEKVEETLNPGGTSHSTPECSPHRGRRPECPGGGGIETVRGLAPELCLPVGIQDSRSPAPTSCRHNDAALAATFETVDVLVTPPAPQTAFSIGDYEANLTAGGLCWAFSPSGHPTVTVSAGLLDGLQAIAAHHRDELDAGPEPRPSGPQRRTPRSVPPPTTGQQPRSPIRTAVSAPRVTSL